MIIIGVDFHPEFQQMASVDTDTGEFQEKRLVHREEAEKFYRGLAVAGKQMRVGMEASGHARWFERLLAELQFELWVGDAAEIRTKLGTLSSPFFWTYTLCQIPSGPVTR
jgi:transposase